MEGQPQQSALAAEAHTAGDIEKGRVEQSTVCENPNAARLFHNKQPSAPVPGRGEVERRGESVCNRLEFDGGFGISWRESERNQHQPKEGTRATQAGKHLRPQFHV